MWAVEQAVVIDAVSSGIFFFFSPPLYCIFTFSALSGQKHTVGDLLLRVLEVKTCSLVHGLELSIHSQHVQKNFSGKASHKVTDAFSTLMTHSQSLYLYRNNSVVLITAETYQYILS